MIVAMDKASARALNLPVKPEKWPRWLHAHLTENLAKRGATVVVFDIVFDEARSSEYDNLFARGDLFMPISNHWKNRILKMGCPDHRIVVHHMGIDLRKFPFSVKEVQCGDTVSLLTVGRLVEKRPEEEEA